MNRTRPVVTLVTPVYDQAEFLNDYLKCIIDQTWRPLQVILVDDGSTDGSDKLLDIAAANGNDDLSIEVIHATHAGQAHAINLALSKVKGEFFTWCDADDRMTVDSIEKKALYLMEHAQDGMVRSNGIMYDLDNGEVIGEYASSEDKERRRIFDDLLYDRTYCYAGTYMLRTDLLFMCYPDKQIPESSEGQNLQLLLPPSSRSTCGYIDEKLHTYRVHHDSHSHRHRSYSEALDRITKFTSLRLKLLDHCECDTEKYTNAIEKIDESSKSDLLRNAVKKARKRN